MPRNPPKLRTAYETLPLILSIITRSIDPIFSSLAPYTAVPSTLSLPINEPVSLVSMSLACIAMLALPDSKHGQQAALEIVPAQNARVPAGIVPQPEQDRSRCDNTRSGIGVTHC